MTSIVLTNIKKEVYCVFYYSDMVLYNIVSYMQSHFIYSLMAESACLSELAENSFINRNQSGIVHSRHKMILIPNFLTVVLGWQRLWKKFCPWQACAYLYFPLNLPPFLSLFLWPRYIIIKQAGSHIKGWLGHHPLYC